MKFLSLIAVFLCLASCSVGTGEIGKNYVAAAPLSPAGDYTKLKKWQTPAYYMSNSLESDIRNLRSRGYVILGSSRFVDTGFSFGHAANQAMKVGATHVIYGEVDEWVNMTRATPSPLLMGFAAAPPLSGVDIDKIITSGSGNSNQSSYDYQDYYYDTPGVVLVPRNFESYFFSKSVDHRVDFGLSLNEADALGVIITAIRTGSMSETLGLRTGDIITQINGYSIASVSEAMDILAATDELSAQTSFFITRDGIESIAIVPPVFGK